MRIVLPDAEQNVRQRSFEGAAVYSHSYVVGFQVTPSAEPASAGSKTLLPSSTDASIFRSEWGRPV